MKTMKKQTNDEPENAKPSKNQAFINIWKKMLLMTRLSILMRSLQKVFLRGSIQIVMETINGDYKGAEILNTELKCLKK